MGADETNFVTDTSKGKGMTKDESKNRILQEWEKWKHRLGDLAEISDLAGEVHNVQNQPALS